MKRKIIMFAATTILPAVIGWAYDRYLDKKNGDLRTVKEAWPRG